MDDRSFNQSAPPSRFAFFAVSFVSCATLIFEIVLTRIFSVTMWYHFSFMVISLAMLGLAVGALVVWFAPRLFSSQDVFHQLSIAAFLFSNAILLSLVYHLMLPTSPLLYDNVSEKSVAFAATVLVFFVPFVLSGICLCLALTRFGLETGRMYAADLIGAGVGCVSVIVLLSVMDGPSTIVFSAFMAGAGSLMFVAGAPRSRRNLWGKGVYVVAVSAFLALCQIRSVAENPIFRIKWVKHGKEASLQYEKWNALSRIAVHMPSARVQPWGGGMSDQFILANPIRLAPLIIDGAAGSHLTEFRGDLEEMSFLKYDVINMAHHLRPQAKVLVIGVGGGRDILSALVFRQPSVLGVEMNGAVLEILQNRFADFTGRLFDYPQVRCVNDEARSFIARTRDRFDIIQASLIDTAAASSAGAFALAEQSLYTVEAWEEFLNHLTPRGVLTFSRWYRIEGEISMEIYKLIKLGKAALERAGVQNVRDHMIVVKPSASRGDEVATLLVSPSPFTGRDMENLEAVCQKRGFSILLSPLVVRDDGIKAIVEEDAELRDSVIPEHMNIEAPTDNRPFFFWAVNPSKWWSGRMFETKKEGFLANKLLENPSGVILRRPEADEESCLPSRTTTARFFATLRMTAVRIFQQPANILATFILAFLFLLFFMLIPCFRRRGLVRWRDSFSFALLFLSIGCGYMLIEISQMQRLILFLGHPVYGLAVILFSLLISSGAGSLAANVMIRRGHEDRIKAAISALIFIAIVSGFTTPWVCREYQSLVTPLRVLLAVLTLLPLGFAMGFPFPLGMRMASKRTPAVTPWYWGVNGAASVWASILAVLTALTAGISTSYWLGTGFYGLAFIALFLPGQLHRPDKT